MFAGAAREAVFSRDDVAERVRTQFVPVALKAALVNNPPPGIEGRLLQEIGRSKPAPQGICIANADGKALLWALSFDDDAAVPAFLDRGLIRFRAFPDVRTPVSARRFMRFPGHELDAVLDTRASLPEKLEHRRGFCPATPPRSSGTLVARLWGRAVGEDGTLAGDCHRQENYVEDIFYVSPRSQAEIVRLLESAAAGEGIDLPESFMRQIVTYSYLGQLDVRPVAPPVPGHRSEVSTLELRATPLGADPSGSRRFRLEGRSDVTSDHDGGRRGDRASYHHRVRLKWEGEIVLDDRRIAELVLFAEGDEELKWGNPRFLKLQKKDPVTHLPAGRPLNVETKVRYGVIGEPIAQRTKKSSRG